MRNNKKKTKKKKKKRKRKRKMNNLRVLGPPNPVQSFGRGAVGSGSDGGVDGPARKLSGQDVERKFKNPYAIWIWAASGTSFFGSPLDLAWIFILFQKYSNFGND